MKIPEPVTIHEQYFYAMTMRLDALCNMVNSLVEHIAEKDKVAVEQTHVKETVKKRPVRKAVEK